MVVLPKKSHNYIIGVVESVTRKEKILFNLISRLRLKGRVKFVVVF